MIEGKDTQQCCPDRVKNCPDCLKKGVFHSVARHGCRRNFSASFRCGIPRDNPFNVDAYAFGRDRKRCHAVLLDPRRQCLSERSYAQLLQVHDFTQRSSEAAGTRAMSVQRRNRLVSLSDFFVGARQKNNRADVVAFNRPALFGKPVCRLRRKSPSIS
jgi:hypothetical protein